MVYLAVDKYGNEFVFESKPRKNKWWWVLDPKDSVVIELPKGSIFKLIGKNLTWDNEPFQLTNKLEG